MNEWTVQSIKGFIAEHKNSGSSYYETKAKDIECLLNEYNGLIDGVLEIIEKELDSERCKHLDDDVLVYYNQIVDKIKALRGEEQ